jgi:hypothetical protein
MLGPPVQRRVAHGISLLEFLALRSWFFDAAFFTLGTQDQDQTQLSLMPL